MYELNGKVKEVFEEKTFGSGFRKKEFVVTTDGKYPQDIKFECVQDKIEQLDGVSSDQQVSVKFDIRGREWNGNYYVNLNAWQISKGAAETSPTEPPPVVDEQDEDIPF